MIFTCPITGLAWTSLHKSKLQGTMRVAHPFLSSPLTEIREHSKNWEELTEDDKRLLWAATLTQNPLLHQVRGSGLRPSPSLVEATFSQLLLLTTWLTNQREPQEFMPSFVPTSPDCENTRGWLSACFETKRDWQEERNSYAVTLQEREETSKMDRLLKKYQAMQKLGTDTLPAKLVHWMLLASEAPTNVTLLWKQLLCSSSEHLTMTSKVTIADLDECLEWFECWEHPTLLRLFAVKQLKEKIKFLNTNSLDGETNLDFLFTEKATPKATFELSPFTSLSQSVAPGSLANDYAPSQLITQADKLDTLKARQAEMAALARARLASFLNPTGATRS